jgi:RNA polymerase sigma-70 factor, ECF subfamily
VSGLDAACRDLLRAADEAGHDRAARTGQGVTIADPDPRADEPGGVPPFDQLVVRHKDAVYRQMLRVCRNQADAEDVLQEALLNAYRATAQLRDPAAFQAWLARIARNVCFRLRRREALRPLLDDAGREALDAVPAGEASVESVLVQQQMDHCVKDALLRVPDGYREVLVLRDVEGLTGPEAAETLRISLPAVKSRLHRARALLRQELDRCFR